MDSSSNSNRREAIAAGVLGLGLAAMAGGARAATMTAAEQANVKLVNDFCAAAAGKDAEKVMAFFAPNPTYRQTETTPPAVGADAVREKITGMVKVVTKFEVLDSWARGPMVINERNDYFDSPRLKKWHGVGVFMIKDGKIVEWQDFTIDRVTA